ncbi:MAG: D-Ala-D-Ala carboxypeptidase family metallohydrolase [Cetobacterium sp.]|uniref:D-Ala-D-Ala carboxypeptidase family metallohydrolase n=1 Tax=Cetobacterium sp. TaxID=2071632 RepID=UPI003EE4E9E5
MRFNMNDRISNYFKYKEAIKTNQPMSNHPTAAEETKIIFAAYRMDLVREVLKTPIIVNSWFRNRDVNEAVGGEPLSQHTLGTAIDFRCETLTPRRIVELIKMSGISYDQLIEYDTFVHISFKFVWDDRKVYIDKTTKK